MTDLIKEMYGEHVDLVDNLPWDEFDDKDIAYIQEQAVRTELGKAIGLLRSANPTGDQIREFIAEAEHGSWDGWEVDDLKSVAALFNDMALYIEGMSK